MAVAVSGGRDSLALLHATARQAAALGLGVAALHVHHGLHPDADAWAQHVRRLCEQWADEGLPLRWFMRRLPSAPAAGESVEAWARRERYAALASMAREAGAGLVLLGHHREDQAETVMLQALRGAGPAGLAAMPRLRTSDGLVWGRPWLDQPRSRIEAYVAAHGLHPVEDPSNTDPRHARSRLRQGLMPVLRAAFPGADAALARVAQRAGQTRALIDALVERELPALRDGDSLDVPAWLEQPAAWHGELLRAWLGALLPSGAPESLVERLLAELPERRSGRWPAPGGELRLYRGRLGYAASTLTSHAPSTESSPDASSHASPPLVPGCHDLLLWNARLIVETVSTGGLTPALLSHAQWRPRAGGERYQRAPGTPSRSLKKQFQAAGVPAWQRDAPLLWSADGRLLFVPGLGIDARACADPGTPQLGLRWLHAGDGGADGADTAAA